MECLCDIRGTSIDYNILKQFVDLSIYKIDMIYLYKKEGGCKLIIGIRENDIKYDYFL